MEQINLAELSKGIAKELKNDNYFEASELEANILSARIDFNREYEKPKTVIEFIEDHSEHKDILTLSNISTTIGAAKSKKTFFSTILLSALLGNTEFAIKGHAYNLNIIFFDTEQSPYHVQRIVRRLKRLVDENLKGIEIFMLREFMPEMRLAMIDHYLSQQNGKYSVVIIDGVVDLLYDFNDITESKRISTKLLEWSGKYNCHINCILHTNKDQKNARGHLGTELMNKSETVFRVAKTDNDTSEVICDMSRNAGFKTFAFKLLNGIPQRVEMPIGFYDNRPKKTEPVNQRYEIEQPRPITYDLNEGINPDLIF